MWLGNCSHALERSEVFLHDKEQSFEGLATIRFRAARRMIRNIQYSQTHDQTHKTST
jgi:hypothetical protein